MSNNSLTLLISAEKKYLDTLIFIDSQLSPLWMNQFKSAAPDFSELLLCIQNILKVNKPFYKNLTQMKSQNELGKALMQWITDFKEPYEHYSKQYIHDLNQRKEICTTSIQSLLHKLSNETTLETLFNAPLEQLVTYKSLFNSLSLMDPAALIQANKVISAMINRTTYLNSLHSSIDCSQVKSIDTMEIIPNYQLPLPNFVNIIRDDVFHTTDSLLSTPVRLILTQDVLYYLKDKGELVYPPVPVADVTIRAALPDRELVGEYSIELELYKNHKVLLQTPSKPIRHEWLDDDESSELEPVIHVSQPVPLVESSVNSKSVYNSENNNEVEPEVPSTKLEMPVVNKQVTEANTGCPTPPPKPVSKALPSKPQQNVPIPPVMVVHDRDSDINKTSPASANLSPSSSFTMASKKRNSFMQSVLSVVSKSNLIGQKQSNRSSSLKKGANVSAVSLEPPPKDPSIQQRRFSQFPPSENSPIPPQHLTLPNSPYARNLNQSTPSFNSTLSSSQTSLSSSSSPPLSRSSSPASKHPALPASEDFASPPASPDSMTNGNAIRQVLFGSKQCQIFRWKDDSWYAVEEQNLLQIRQTFNNRACLTVQLEPSGELYLNAWILPDTFLQRISATDITISVTMAASQAENYLIHCDTESSATQLIQVLEKMHAVSQTININNGNNTLRGAPPVLSRSSSLPTNAPKMTAEELQKTLKLVMQCKCKLYVQNQSSNWHSFGSVHLKISNQWTTRKMHIDLSSHKGSKVTQLVSSMVQSRNVERLGPKRISFLLIDELQKTNVVYMIQVREELTGDKILEYIKEKNAENGW